MYLIAFQCYRLLRHCELNDEPPIPRTIGVEEIIDIQDPYSNTLKRDKKSNSLNMPATKSKRNKREDPYQSKKIAEEEAEERALSTLLFGNQGESFEPDDPNIHNDYEDEIQEIKSKEEEIPVWVDDDDERLTVQVSTGKNRLRKLRKTEAEHELGGNEYNERLRARFETSHFGISTQWASVDDDGGVYNIKDDEDDDDVSVSFEGVLQDSAPMVGHSMDLPPNIIDMKRCRDVNYAEPSDVTIQAVNFHSSGEVVLSAGFDKVLRFFRVDGEKNPKISGIYLENFPIYSASFLGQSGKVVVSSRRPHYYVYDSVAGKVRLQQVRNYLSPSQKISYY